MLFLFAVAACTLERVDVSAWRGPFPTVADLVVDVDTPPPRWELPELLTSDAVIDLTPPPAVALDQGLAWNELEAARAVNAEASAAVVARTLAR